MRYRLLHPLASLPLLIGLLGCSPSEVSETGAPGPEMAALPVQAAAPEVEPDTAWEDLAPNARRPLPGLITGGQPSVEQLSAARDLGVTTVVNLRRDEEPGTKAADSEALGLAYVGLPIRGAEDLTAEKAAELAEILGSAEGEVLLHCGSGNRVGALLALKAFHVDGLGPEESLDLGRAAGLTGLEPLVIEALGLPE